MCEAERIRELEMLAESYRYAAMQIADELISILKPYREGDFIASAKALHEVASKHLLMELHGGGEVH